MNKRGFTLIEIIIVLIIAGIFAAMTFPYLYASLTKSALPVQNLQQSFSLKRVMENITQDWTTTTLAALSASIGAEGSNKDNAYGQYTVVFNRLIGFAECTNPPCTRNEAAGNNVLKVTIQDTQGGQLTTVFYER